MWRALAGLRHEGLVVLALVFAASAMVEGGIATWGILYLRGHLGLGVLAGVSAYVVGESLATVARFGGGPIIGRLGTRRAVVDRRFARRRPGSRPRRCAASPASRPRDSRRPPSASRSCGRCCSPTSTTKPRHPALAIGGVTACGYLGMVAGPPLVGTLSALFGLQVGLLVLAAIALVVAIVPAHVRTPVRAVAYDVVRGRTAVGQPDVAERAPQQRRLRVERFRERFALLGRRVGDERRRRLGGGGARARP